MKSKRKIVRSIKSQAIKLMNLYFSNEHGLATCGISTISEEESYKISETLSNYAQILYRNLGDESAIYKNDWASELMNFY